MFAHVIMFVAEHLHGAWQNIYTAPDRALQRYVCVHKTMQLNTPDSEVKDGAAKNIWGCLAFGGLH